jgi:hypothetical protein
MTVTVRKGHLPHIKWIDLQGDGVLTECAVMSEDKFANITFIRVNYLDQVDRRRLLKIVSNRNATNFPLWDLMSNITLNNGINALTYFHQMVEMITARGKLMRPKSGEIGTGVIDTNQLRQEAAEERATAERHAGTKAPKAPKSTE